MCVALRVARTLSLGAYRVAVCVAGGVGAGTGSWHQVAAEGFSLLSWAGSGSWRGGWRAQWGKDLEPWRGLMVGRRPCHLGASTLRRQGGFFFAVCGAEFQRCAGAGVGDMKEGQRRQATLAGTSASGTLGTGPGFAPWLWGGLSQHGTGDPCCRLCLAAGPGSKKGMLTGTSEPGSQPYLCSLRSCGLEPPGHRMSGQEQP